MKKQTHQDSSVLRGRPQQAHRLEGVVRNLGIKPVRKPKGLQT